MVNTTMSSFRLFLEARQPDEYVKDRLSKYIKHAEYIKSLDFELDYSQYYSANDSVTHRSLSFRTYIYSYLVEKYPSGIIDERKIEVGDIWENVPESLTGYNFSSYEYMIYDIIPFINDKRKLESSKLTVYPGNYSNAKTTLDNLEIVLNNFVKNRAIKLQKNSRIDYLLDWWEYFYIHEYSIKDLRHVFFNSPSVSGKVVSKITSKYGDEFSISEERDAFREFFDWVDSLDDGDTEEMEKILRRDGFQSVFRLPSQLMELVNNRKIDGNEDLLKRIKENLPEGYQSDFQLAILIMELFKKSSTSYDFDEDEAFLILRHALIHADLHDVKKYIRQSSGLYAFFNKFYVSIDDVNEYSRPDGYVWVWEEGKDSNAIFKTQLSNCGSDDSATEMWNLCTPFPFGDDEFLYTHVMAAVSDADGKNNLIQSHGPSNGKPEPEFHSAIVSFINDYIDNISYCTAHSPENCFKPEQLNFNLREKLKSTVTENCFDVDEEEEVDEMPQIESLVNDYNLNNVGDVSIDYRYGDVSLDYEVSINLPKFLEGDYEDRSSEYIRQIQDGHIEIKTFTVISDWDEGRPTLDNANSALEQFADILDEIDFDEVINEIISNDDTTPKILKAINELSQLKVSVNKNNQSIRITPSIMLNTYSLDYEHNNAPYKERPADRDYDRSTSSYYSKNLPLMDETEYTMPPFPHVRQALDEIIFDINEQKYIDNYFKNKPRVRTHNQQPELKFESAVAANFKYSWDDTDLGIRFRMIGLTQGYQTPNYEFGLAIDFPTFENDWTPSGLYNRYRKYLRIMSDIGESKYRDFNDYIEDLINSYDSHLKFSSGQLVCFNTYRPAFNFKSSFTQRSKMRNPRNKN